MDIVIKNTLMLIKIVKEGDVKNNLNVINTLLANGANPFLVIGGSCAFKEVAVKGDLGLVRAFCRFMKDNGDLDRALRGPYNEIELDVDLEEMNMNLAELANLSGLDIDLRNAISGKVPAVDGVEIRGNRFIFESHNNTLLHCVCKSETFNVDVLDVLIRLGGLRYLDSANDLLQNPDRCIELNIFVNNKNKETTKSLLNKMRQLRLSMNTPVMQNGEHVNGQIPEREKCCNLAGVCAQQGVEQMPSVEPQNSSPKRKQDIQIAEGSKKRRSLHDAWIVSK